MLDSTHAQSEHVYHLREYTSLFVLDYVILGGEDTQGGYSDRDCLCCAWQAIDCKRLSLRTSGMTLQLR
jgi:hypothetical protein